MTVRGGRKALSGRRSRALIAGLLAGLVAGLGLAGCEASHDAVLFTNVVVVDGTGAEAYPASVRVRNGLISDVGTLGPLSRDLIIDGAGLVLAPGFIDTHSHHDGGLEDMRDAAAAVSQGITSIVVGQDGGSRLPLTSFFGRLVTGPVAVNVASYTGHGRLRREVMGDDFRRPATDAEIAEMADLLQDDMDTGSLGLSSGLEYDPGIYSTTEELIALARVAAANGGRYISHMRSEDRALFDAVDEIIRIGREAEIPVQISHMKLAMRSLWGRADELIDKLEAARADGVDVTADVYPYEYWQSTMTVLFPDREYTREAAAFALAELAPPEGMIVGRFTPETAYEGMTLAEIATQRGEDAVTTYLTLIDMVHGPDAPDDAAEGIVARSMVEEDIVRLLQWEHTNVCTDGGLAGPHPRGFGSFTRVLRRYVRDDGVISLEDAIHRMTGLSARHVGLSGRGTIEIGAAADLVLFDPTTVADNATIESPDEISTGIVGVWVNGVRVWEDAAPTGARPGMVLTPGG